MWTPSLASLAAVLVAGATAVVTGANGRVAFRANASIPQLAWQIRDQARGRPDVDEHSAYFLSRRDEVVAVADTRGRVRWRAPLGPRFVDGSTAGSRVVVAGPVVVAGGQDLMAFDRLSGRRQWSYAPASDHSFGLYLGDAWGEDVFAGSASGALVSIDAATGLLHWRARVGGPRTTVYTPVASDDEVAAAFRDFDNGGLGGIVVVDRSTGKERWRRTLPPSEWVTDGGVAGGPVFTDEAVFITGHDGSVHALSRDSGHQRWTMPPSRSPDYRPLVAVSGSIIAGSLQGEMAAYDEDTGRERWRTRPVLASVAFEMAADADTVYVPYLSGELVAVDAEDGRELWRIGAGQGFRWLPRVMGDRIYVAGSVAGFFKFIQPFD